MNGRGLQKDFCAAAPDHDGARQVVLLLKVFDIVSKLVGKLHFVGGFFNVCPVQPPHISFVKGCRPGTDSFESGTDLSSRLRSSTPALAPA